MAEAICWQTRQRGALALRNIILFTIICVLGTLLHIGFLSLNEVLKIADSFAYLQMANFLQQFSQEWLGNGWFGFVYSLPIAFLDYFVQNTFISAKIVNIFLLNISAVLLWKISKKILSPVLSLCVIGIFFLSPTFLHFNIHVLSENIYIPLFLGVFLITLNFTEKITESVGNADLHSLQDRNENICSLQDRTACLRSLQTDVIILACLLGLMYLTRAEAFIYLLSIGIISITLLAQKKLSIKKFIWLWSLFLLSFVIFISPYLIHLNSMTWEWGLTNKWASNLRQAELRGVERMDDAGFEQAVAELTPDNTQLIAGFAGWMLYTRPEIEWSLWGFISRDPVWFLERIVQNQQKLFTRNLPEIFLWKAPKLYFDETQKLFYKNTVFLFFCILPLFVLIFGGYRIFREQKIFFYTSLAFFIPAFIFFTLFFTLNRYFLIFLPLIFIYFCFWISSISLSKKYFSITSHNILKIFLFTNIIWVYVLSLFVYYNIEKSKDEYYSLKQEAWEWLKQNSPSSTPPKIMERFPIATYYSWAEYRWITPYTDDIKNIQEYALYNSLDILIVDTMDFETYRPKLKKHLWETPEWFSKLKEFSNTKNQKVILYELNK